MIHRLLTLAIVAVVSTPVLAQQVGGVQGAGAPPATAPAGPVKIAFVDSRIIIDKAPGRAAAESTFNREYDAAKASVQKMQDTLKAMVSAYQKQQATLSAVSRELRENEINDKQKSFENRAGLMEAQMQQRQAELVQPMMTQIRELLEVIRGEDGISMIFDVGAQGAVIVAADKALDITEKVIGRLKPLPLVTKGDSTKAGAKPTPAGVTKPIKPPTS